MLRRRNDVLGIFVFTLDRPGDFKTPLTLLLELTAENDGDATLTVEVN